MGLVTKYCPTMGSRIPEETRFVALSKLYPTTSDDRVAIAFLAKATSWRLLLFSDHVNFAVESITPPVNLLGSLAIK